MRDREAFQEVDYRAVFGPLAKWATEIDARRPHPRDRRPRLRRGPDRPPGAGGGGAARGRADRADRGAWPARRCGCRRPPPSPEDVAEIARLLDARRARRWSSPAAAAGARPGARACAPSPRRTGCRWSSASADQDLLDNASPSYAGDAGLGKTPARPARCSREADVILAVGLRFGEILTDGYSLFGMPADGGDADPRPRLGRRAQQDRDRRPAGARPSRPADAGARRAPPRRRRPLGRRAPRPRTPPGGRASPRRRSPAGSTWARWSATCRRCCPPTRS